MDKKKTNESQNEVKNGIEINPSKRLCGRWSQLIILYIIKWRKFHYYHKIILHNEMMRE